jgi:hypothetical protein
MATKKAGISDKFANIAATYFAMTTLNTARFVKFDFPFSIMDKVGLLINRMEYIIGGLDKLNSTLDWAIGGLACASTVADTEDTRDPLIVDQYKLQRIDMGTAASGMIVEAPFMKDFSGLPGGGILVPPSPLYAFMDSDGASDVMTLRIRIYYQYLELSPEDYWQLVESRRVVTG